MGMYQAINAVSTIIGPYVGGQIYGHWGGKVLWMGCAGLGLLCFVLCLSLFRQDTRLTQ